MSTPDSSTQSLTADTALATIALRNDAYATVLARRRLDFCCAGKRTLSQACAAAGLDVNGVLAELDAEVVARTAVTTAARDWNERPLAELVDFIVDTHHGYTRAAIARITPLLAKVAGKHRDRHPELARIARAFGELAPEMESHMMREERVLFPYIKTLAQPGTFVAPPFTTVRNPVRMMLAEHDRAAVLLGEIDEATGGFAAPMDACTSYRALYAALAELHLDLLKHVSIENNVLFPRAIAIEERRRTTPPESV